MPQKCIVDQCKRTSRVICKCCIRDLCLEHFWHHNDSIVTQLTALKKEVTELDTRYKTLDTLRSPSTFRQQMKQWRVDSYTTIDQYCDRKSYEYDYYIKENLDKQRQSIYQLQKRIDGFIETEYGKQHDIDLLKLHLNDIRGKIDNIEKTSSPVITLPLTVNENLIQIRH